MEVKNNKVLKIIQEIQKTDFKNVISLFEGVYYNLNSLAVINGHNHGRIWINDLEQPSIGMLVDNEWATYLTGDHTDKEFNEQAGKIIREEIFPAAEKHAMGYNPEYNNGEWVIYYSNEEWLKAIEQDFGIEDILPLRRYHYIFKNLKLDDWRKKVPKDYSMQFVDKEFLTRKYLNNFEEIKNWIKTSWKSEEDFFSRGFGFCLVKNDKEIISWGMADWVTENNAEMGIGTDETYRRQGFATIVVSATAEYCQEKGLKLGWHCSEHNTASWKTAEKVGFVREREYTAALGCFDEKYNLWENAWYRGLYLKRPDEGLYYIDKLLTKEEPKSRHMQIKAQLLIQAGKPEEAVEMLYKAVDLGPQNMERFRINLLDNDFFSSVRKLNGFSILIEKINKLIEED